LVLSSNIYKYVRTILIITNEQ